METFHSGNGRYGVLGLIRRQLPFPSFDLTDCIESKKILDDWAQKEQEQFFKHRDKNGDKRMDRSEIGEWIMPSDYDPIDAEAKHLIYHADDDKVTTYIVKVERIFKLIFLIQFRMANSAYRRFWSTKPFSSAPRPSTMAAH